MCNYHCIMLKVLQSTYSLIVLVSNDLTENKGWELTLKHILMKSHGNVSNQNVLQHGHLEDSETKSRHCQKNSQCH